MMTQSLNQAIRAIQILLMKRKRNSYYSFKKCWVWGFVRSMGRKTKVCLTHVWTAKQT